MSKKYTTDNITISEALNDGSGVGTSGQVLSSTGSGVSWIDGSGIVGGPYLPLTGGTLTGDIHFNDSVKANFGGSDSAWELEIYANTSNDAYIDKTATSVGDLIIQNQADDSDIIFKSDNGSGGLTTYFFLDGGSVATQFNQRALFIDNIAAEFGSSRDLKIYHDGSNSYINETGTGVLSIQSDGTEVQINKGATEYMGRFITDAGVKLYYDNSLKFETTSTGVTVTGNLDTTGSVSIPDAGKLYLGSGDDLHVYHAGTHGYVLNKTGDLYLMSQVHGGDIIFKTENSSGTAVTPLTLDSAGDATFIGALTLAGKVSGVTAGTANTDAVNLQQLNDATTGVLVYQGVWNASTNTPTLASATGTAGYYYIVSVAGTTSLDGITDWAVGDWAVFSDMATDAWQKIDNTSILGGAGTGGTVALWSGSGTSLTLSDAPITASGGNTTITGKLGVGSVNAGFDFYNNGTTYLNGATTVDAAFTQSGGAASTFSGDVTFAGQINSQTANFTDNVYMSGGQLYLGASGASTDDSYRLYATSGQFVLASRESGTWTTRFDIDTSGNATFAGSVTTQKADNVLLVESTNAGQASLDLKNTEGHYRIITDAGEFKIFDQTDSRLPFLINTSGNATFAGDVMPAAENAHNIGSASVRWEDLYVDDGYLRDAYIDEYIYHNSDTNTYIQFPGTNDKIVFTTNGSDHLTLDATPNATFAGDITSVGLTVDYTGNRTGDAGILVTNDSSDWGIKVDKDGTTDYGILSQTDGDNAIVVRNAAGTTNIQLQGDGDATFAGKVVTAEVESSGALLLDAAADITIDAGGGDIILSDDATIFGTISSGGGSIFQIRSRINNADMFFRGVDDGTEFNALTLDMSAGGNATFAGNLEVQGADVTITANIIHAGDPNTYFGFNTNDSWRVVTGGTQALILDSSQNATFAGTVAVNGTNVTVANASNPYIYLNDTNAGAGIFQQEGNTTRIGSDSDTQVVLVQNNATAVTIDTSKNATFAGDVIIPATKALYFDGGGGTYIYESADGVMDFYCDTKQLLTLKQNGTQNEVIVNEGSVDVDFRVESNNDTAALFVQGSDGSVGIGTSSPAYKLDVAGDAQIQSSYFLRFANEWGIQQTGTDLNFAEIGSADGRLYLKAGGNVGIGATAPGEKLEVAGNIIAKDSGFLAGVGGDKDGFVFHDLYTGGGNYYGYKAYTDNSNTRLSVVTDGSERITALAGGNVGIGTTSPAEKLEVSGGHIKITNSGNANLYINANDSGSDATIFFEELDSVKAKIQHDASNDSMLFTDGSYTDTMTLKGGNVGINTTAPGEKLVVDETTTNTLDVARFKHNQSSVVGSVIFENSSGGNNTGFNLNFKTGASGYGGVLGVIRTNSPDAGDSDMFLSSGGGKAITILHDGAVGIGTSTPSSFNSRGQNLVVNGTGNTGITISASSTDSSTLLFADGTGGTAAYRGIIEYDHADDSMAISTAAAEKMRITSAGLVGINTTAPLAKLDVRGTLRSDQDSSGPDGTSGVGELTTLIGDAGPDDTALGTPDQWLRINISGTDYVIPAYTAP